MRMKAYWCNIRAKAGGLSQPIVKDHETKPLSYVFRIGEQSLHEFRTDESGGFPEIRHGVTASREMPTTMMV